MTQEHPDCTVLLVDDTPANLGILVDTLNHAGLNVSVAKSGAKAIQQAEALKPDLIVLDVLMPGLDGFETCLRLKQAESTREIPVIFMTALTETVEKVKGFEVGGVDYITKPFHIDEVMARIHAHLTIRRLQHTLAQKNQQLVELNATKDLFFSIMAHDLRNPLSSFISFASLLDHIDHLGKDEFIALKTEFRVSAERLLALLENLLTWSRLQRGMIRCSTSDIPLQALIHKTIDLFLPNARQKQVTLRSICEEDLLGQGDLNMLDITLRNLVSNAMKFTRPGGTIEISAVREEQTITVSVRDTGIGIPLEKMTGVFDIGQDVQRNGTDGEKGTGLGLILCKEFIERQGGRIWAESEVGKGSTFSFTLALKSAESDSSGMSNTPT